jgi:hypothetical protein
VTLQINALNIMCSNFWIATKILKDINEFLTSMNDIYNVRVQLGEEIEDGTMMKSSKEEVHDLTDDFLKSSNFTGKIEVEGSK